MNRRQVLRAAAAAPFAASFAGRAFAQAWPAREIIFNVPVAPGGGGDLSSRSLMDAVQAKLGAPIVVKNVTGGGGAIGLKTLVESPPDGYVSGLMGVTSHVILPRTTTLGFDPMATTDLVARIIDLRYGIAVAAASPITTIDDLVAAGKTRRLNYSSNFVGNVVAMYKLAKLTGGTFNWVRAAGGTEAMTQAAGGHVDAAIQTVTEMLPLLKAGSLRLIASASPTRWPEFPEVKTLRESGYDAVNVGYLGVAFPKGAPEEARQRFETAIEESMKSPDLVQRFTSLGLVPSYASGADFYKQLRALEGEIAPILAEVGMAR